MGLAIRLSRAGEVFGIFSIWRPGDVPISDDARLFVAELAAEITGRLYHLSLLADRRILRDSLFRRENEYERIVRDAPLGILRLSPTGEILSLNRRCAEFLGFQHVRSALATVSVAGTDIFENPPEWTAFLERLSVDREIREFEFSARRTGGEPIRLSMNARLQYEAEGMPPVILCFLQDVTDLSRALRRAEVLLREVHHRVKNNLAVVLSLLNLEEHRLGEPGSARIFERSSSRIRAIATVHEIVYRSTRVEEIALHELVNEIVAMTRYGESRGRSVHLTIDAEPIPAGIDGAVPFALILLELLSNAFEHGGTDDAVTLEVELRRRSDGSILLTVRDAGEGYGVTNHVIAGSTGRGGRPDAGLGLQLVEMLVAQLGGNWTMNAREDGPGTSCEVLLPCTVIAADNSGGCRETPARV